MKRSPEAEPLVICPRSLRIIQSMQDRGPFGSAASSAINAALLADSDFLACKGLEGGCTGPEETVQEVTRRRFFLLGETITYLEPVSVCPILDKFNTAPSS